MYGQIFSVIINKDPNSEYVNTCCFVHVHKQCIVLTVLFYILEYDWVNSVSGCRKVNLLRSVLSYEAALNVAKQGTVQKDIIKGML